MPAALDGTYKAIELSLARAEKLFEVLNIALDQSTQASNRESS